MDERETVVAFGSLEAWTRAVSLATGAVGRRWVRVAALTAAFAAAGAAAAAVLPRSYSAETRLLARTNYVMPALAHPKRAVPMGTEGPTESAAEFVLNRRSLERIVERLALVERWDRERAPLMAVKDRATAWIKGPLDADEKAEVIVDMLADRIKVSVEDKVIRVRATWPARETVVEIVGAAVDAFLEARRKIDIQAIADTYAILQRSADSERARVEQQVEAVAGVRRVSPVEPAPPEPGPPPARAETAAGPIAAADEGLDDLRARIADAQRAREQAEAQHAAEVRELEQRLAEKRSTRTEQHPDVQALRAALDWLKAEVAPIERARAAAAALKAEYLTHGRTTGRPDATERRADLVAVAAALSRPASPEDEDPVLTYQRGVLKNSIETYHDLRDRLADVQIELQTAEAAFGYRYAVTVPARLPKKADSPNVAMLLIGAIMAGLLCGVTGAIFQELRGRALLSPSRLSAYLGSGLAVSAS